MTYDRNGAFFEFGITHVYGFELADHADAKAGHRCICGAPIPEKRVTCGEPACQVARSRARARESHAARYYADPAYKLKKQEQSARWKEKNAARYRRYLREYGRTKRRKSG